MTESPTTPSIEKIAEKAFGMTANREASLNATRWVLRAIEQLGGKVVWS